MGKSLLAITSIAITLLSLISVDSTVQDIETAKASPHYPIIELKHLILLDANLTRCKSNQQQEQNLFTYLVESAAFQTLASVIGLLQQVGIFVYCCLAIGALCDQYFVPSLESVGKRFSLSASLTSSILIPLGTSGPEIFSSIVGVFIADNDIGTGSIIGSSLYNLVAIPAVCGLSATYFFGKTIKIEAEPVLKDLLFYVVAVIGLIFTIKDQTIDLMEAFLLEILFIMYIGVKVCSQESVVEKNVDENNNCIDNEEIKHVVEEIIEDENNNDNNDDDDEEEELMNNKYINYLLVPILALYQITIPRRNNPMLSFVFSMLWLSGLSYLSVEAITKISETLSIPTTIAGMTILAAGSAVPDMITSVIVMKKNCQGSLGIATPISANIIAILFGLGFPWLIKCLMSFITKSQTSFLIQTESLPFTCLLLLVAIFAVIFGLNNCNFKMGTNFAVICITIQIIFTFTTVMLELFCY